MSQLAANPLQSPAKFLQIGKMTDKQDQLSTPKQKFPVTSSPIFSPLALQAIKQSQPQENGYQPIVFNPELQLPFQICKCKLIPFHTKYQTMSFAIKLRTVKEFLYKNDEQYTYNTHTCITPVDFIQRVIPLYISQTLHSKEQIELTLAINEVRRCILDSLMAHKIRTQLKTIVGQHYSQVKPDVLRFNAALTIQQVFTRLLKIIHVQEQMFTERFDKKVQLLWAQMIDDYLAENITQLIQTLKIEDVMNDSD
ncbi:Hypothetical_protein [Hexamita inflata]|uniref:Hypothetical_protein n=1 Tax=Hexamita inflata TaxID=28002 RepID=A0AA86U8H5_9EUKA|nr:Hypothetical protein HINF_LOCUS29312 [Hexamita inflata]